MRTTDGSLKLFPLIDKSGITTDEEDTIGNEELGTTGPGINEENGSGIGNAIGVEVVDVGSDIGVEIGNGVGSDSVDVGSGTLKSVISVG